MKSPFSKKIFLSVLAMFFCAAPALLALPGVNYLISDVSGQYIFYEDKSFSRESYIGIVFYDESTYGVRYFAPSFGKNSTFKPEKDISILFTLNEKENHVELTGERIITAVTPDDTDLVNYIHDFLYEMTARRQKAGDVTEKTKLSQIYEQFGGEVLIEYDPLVPITNLSKIENDGKTVLEIVTAGQLVSSSDTSFSDFKGFPPLKDDKSKKYNVKKSAQQEFSFSSDGKTVSALLNKNWEQKNENIWVLGNSAVFMMNNIPSLDERNFLQLERRLVLSSEHVYSDWRKLSLKEENERIKIDQIFYDNETKSFKTDCKILYKEPIFFVSLTANTKTYDANKKYFSSIIKSIELK